MKKYSATLETKYKESSNKLNEADHKILDL